MQIKKPSETGHPWLKLYLIRPRSISLSSHHPVILQWGKAALPSWHDFCEWAIDKPIVIVLHTFDCREENWLSFFECFSKHRNVCVCVCVWMSVWKVHTFTHPYLHSLLEESTKSALYKREERENWVLKYQSKFLNASPDAEPGEADDRTSAVKHIIVTRMLLALASIDVAISFRILFFSTLLAAILTGGWHEAALQILQRRFSRLTKCTMRLVPIYFV